MRRSTTYTRTPKARPGRPRKPWFVWATVGTLLVAAALVVAGLALPRSHKSTSPVRSRLSAAEASAASTLSADAPLAAASQAVEVPDIEGTALDEARMVLEAAGFVVRVRYAGTTDGGDAVSKQQPQAGQVLAAGSVVELTAPRMVKKKTAVQKRAAGSSAGSKYVVVIDPGHQRRGNSTPEPIGPGAKTSKPSVTGGTTGTTTGLPEYEVVLQVSMNLRKQLQARGVKVVMTRMTNDVDLSNSARAAIANKAKADLFVRIHADGSPEHKVSGISTLFPGVNQWTRPISASSKRAARALQTSVVSSTGAVNRGIVSRVDLSGFNYSHVPSVLVETGFMSNTVEDKLLSSPHYQDKLAAGMADGILAYLGGAR